MGLSEFLRLFLALGPLLPLSSGYHEESASSSSSAYLKVCGKDEKHLLDSRSCGRGVWLRHPIEPGCICVRGIWALSNGFCDEKPMIIVGNGDCFHIGTRFQSAKLIGDAKDPFQPKIYVAPSSLDALYELDEKAYTPALLTDLTLVVAVNPRQVAQRKDFGVCLDLPPEDFEKPVHIYVNPRRTLNEWMLNPKDTFTCPVVKPYKYHVGFGEMFINDRVEPRLLVQRHCEEDCPGARGQQDSGGPMGRSLTSAADSIETVLGFRSRPASTFPMPILPQNEPVHTLSKNIMYHKPPKTKDDIEIDKEEARALAAEDEEHLLKETNEQTLRMMHSHISPLLLNISGATVITREYQYFQLMRQVVEKACPNDFVPKLLVRGLMRMFRQLLWETQESFTHSESGDDDQHARTMNVLTHCMNSTDNPSFLFSDLTDSYSNDSTDAAPLTHAWYNHSMLPPERCPNPFIFSVNGTMYNMTTYDRANNLYVRNISQYWPNLKYKPKQMDIVIETAWKIVVMGHYRCSRYFNETSYSDYSNFFSRMQSFFNAKIMRRWYYKPSVNATYNIVELIFPSYDLKKFMFGMDACLLGIQRFSNFDYSNVYVHRPKYPATPDDLVNKVARLEGQAYWDKHLNTFDYAPDPKWPNPFFQVDKKLYPPPPPPPGRRKRSDSWGSINFDLWGNQARCIHNYVEPLRKPTAFGYHVPPGCISPTGL
ncbi:hypothetical protein Ocin01_15883 [Orchesella cincta]|uniref:Uncharacterized protein n=1 Tax=Orchesella cincta TaxID=48709 RepID=A0A1D2MCX6_ORCCI|nr:hypothetical protein Ocin01_15883 [Orchesella cincta]